jgi:hypothetical protein
MMHFYELAAMLPSLHERERQVLLVDAGSIKAIANQNSEFFVSRLGLKRARSVLADLLKFQTGASAKPQPLIVPIRFVESEGGADDLIPIETRQ